MLLIDATLCCGSGVQELHGVGVVAVIGYIGYGGVPGRGNVPPNGGHPIHLQQQQRTARNKSACTFMAWPAEYLLAGHIGEVSGWDNA